jgi:hypothetical protein
VFIGAEIHGLMIINMQVRQNRKKEIDFIYPPKFLLLWFSFLAAHASYSTISTNFEFRINYVIKSNLLSF